MTGPVRGARARARGTAAVLAAALVAGLLTGAGAASAADPASALRERVLAALAGSTASVTGVVVAADGLGPAVDVNGTVGLPPASTQKLYTGAAALMTFGPESRLRTEVRRTGPLLPDGTVGGDLVLVGGGDPTVTGDDLQRLAFAVAATGVRHVGGWLYGDDTRYDRRRDAPGWKDSFMPGQSGPLSALVVDRNEWRRDPAFLHDPVAPNVWRFRVALERAGIGVNGPDAVGAAPGGPGELVAVHASEPMGVLVGRMLKPSDNFAAELMLKELGTTIGAGTTAGGLEVVWRVAESLGLGRGQAADGSGLSAHNRAAPMHEVGWLLRLAGTPLADHVRHGMPLACGDGTLQQRFCATPAAGKVFAKTGTLSGVVALAGYTTTSSGRRAFFAFQMAGVASISRARAAIDRAVLELVAFAG